MNKLDVENIAVFARHLKVLRDKITTAKIIHDSRSERMMFHRMSYPCMEEEKREMVFFEEEREAMKDVELEYDEALSIGCMLGLRLPFTIEEIKDYIKT